MEACTTLSTRSGRNKIETAWALVAVQLSRAFSQNLVAIGCHAMYTMFIVAFPVSACTLFVHTEAGVTRGNPGWYLEFRRGTDRFCYTVPLIHWRCPMGQPSAKEESRLNRMLIYYVHGAWGPPWLCLFLVSIDETEKKGWLISEHQSRRHSSPAYGRHNM